MRKVTQAQLTEHVNLVKWQQQKQLQKFNLLTIHSLLLNTNPKFVQLKTKIQTFNSMIDKTMERKHLQFQYTKKLYQLLGYMVNIKIYERQQEFLEQVYEWSKGGRVDWDFEEGSRAGGLSGGGKSRPTTATTRARPFSAYSRPQSGYQKLVITKVEQQLSAIDSQKKSQTNIDYQKLKPGDIQFFTGQRTIHQNNEKPKKRLKQYQRKIFYDQEEDSDLQIIDMKDDKPIFQFKTKSVNAQFKEQHLGEQILKGDGVEDENKPEGEQLFQGEDEQIGGQGEDDVNIDDLPIDGDGQYEQAQQVIDKLRPRYKAFVKHQTQLLKDQSRYAKGVNRYIEERNKLIRSNAEDDIIKGKMLEWAKEKGRTNRELKRRAQSARIVTRQVGIGYKKPANAQQENSNVINFENFPVPQTKISRPKTAFRAFNETNRKQLIKNCFITGALSMNIPKIQPQILQTKTFQRQMRITSLAEKPKRKTFEQILRDAEQRVREEQGEEILNMKQKFARSKIPFETNRIAKSVTYYAGGNDEYEDEKEGRYGGGSIVGINMLKNPFFKMGKKKNKKKKKK